MSKIDLDQYYTKDNVAEHCYMLIKQYVPNYEEIEIELEPSAGTGSFYNLMNVNKRYGIDLDPKCNGVIKQDFFTYNPNNIKKIATIGNPPFGINASMAIKFFNHAANFSNVIAFILPRSFKKISIQNKLNLSFWLIYEEDCPIDSFIGNGGHKIPCIFQIWIKKKKYRIKINTIVENKIFDFVKKQDADLAVKRVGGNSGKCSIVSTASESTHYFIKIKQKNILKEDMIKYINSLNFDIVRNSTVGSRSISKGEFLNIFFQNGDKIFELKYLSRNHQKYINDYL